MMLIHLFAGVFATGPGIRIPYSTKVRCCCQALAASLRFAPLRLSIVAFIVEVRYALWCFKKFRSNYYQFLTGWSTVGRSRLISSISDLERIMKYVLAAIAWMAALSTSSMAVAEEIVVTLKDGSELSVSGWVFWLKGPDFSVYTPRKEPGGRFEFTLAPTDAHGDSEVLDLLLRDITRIVVKGKAAKLEFGDGQSADGAVRGVYWTGKGNPAARIPVEDTLLVQIKRQPGKKFEVDGSIRSKNGEVNLTDLEFQLEKEPPHLGQKGNTGIDLNTDKGESTHIVEADLRLVEILGPIKISQSEWTKVRVTKADGTTVSGRTKDGLNFRAMYTTGKLKGAGTYIQFLGKKVQEVKSISYPAK